MDHGEPVTCHEILDWQASCIQRVVGLLRTVVEREGLEGDALADSVSARMTALLPAEDLLFPLRLSVAPMLHRLGLGSQEGRVQA